MEAGEPKPHLLSLALPYPSTAFALPCCRGHSRLHSYWLRTFAQLLLPLRLVVLAAVVSGVMDTNNVAQVGEPWLEDAEWLRECLQACRPHPSSMGRPTDT